MTISWDLSLHGCWEMKQIWRVPREERVGGRGGGPDWDECSGWSCVGDLEWLMNLGGGGTI